MIPWRIYYDDGSTFDASQGEPEDAPSYGVQIIAQASRYGRECLHLWDWYYWREDNEKWWGSDIFGVLDMLLHNQPLRALKQGRNTNSANFEQLMHKAAHDEDLPARSVSRRTDRPSASRPA